MREIEHQALLIEPLVLQRRATLPLEVPVGVMCRLLRSCLVMLELNQTVKSRYGGVPPVFLPPLKKPVPSLDLNFLGSEYGGIVAVERKTEMKP